MLVKTLLTASILSVNTFYPLAKIGNPKSNLSFKRNVVLYDRCLFYNNSCVLPINEIYPDLHKYNNLFIYNTINKYKIGEIEDITILKKNKFNKVYINFYYWYSENERNNKLFQHLNNGGSIKIFYNESISNRRCHRHLAWHSI